jgi:hypothetical protein
VRCLGYQLLYFLLLVRAPGWRAAHVLLGLLAFQCCVYFFFCQLADHVYELSVAIFYLMKRQYTFHLSSKINEILHFEIFVTDQFIFKLDGDISKFLAL